MNISYLGEFVKVAKHLNFSMAAEVLHISQPVLTRHIMKLEDELDIKLLDRNTQGVMLTDAGKVFLQRVIPILDDYEKLKSEMRIIKKGYDASIRIGVPYYGMEHYLGSIPEEFEKRYPSIKVEYRVGSLNEVLRFISEGEVDVAIAPNFGYPKDGHFDFYEMFKERLGVLISSSHPLAKQDKCSLRDLKDITFYRIDNDYSNNSWELTQELCKKAGFMPDEPETFASTEVATISVRQGKGILILGEHMKLLESEKLSFVELSDAGCYRNVCLWKRKSSTNDDAQKFINMCLRIANNRH